MRAKVEQAEKRADTLEGTNNTLQEEKDALVENCTKLSEEVEKYKKSAQVLGM